MPRKNHPEASLPTNRIATRITPKLDKHLFAYAAAATAAGVGMLAASPSAEAKIVYTPVNAKIPVNTLVPLDLNNDGVADFDFYFFTYGPRKSLSLPLGFHKDDLAIEATKAGNEVWEVQTSKWNYCAAALPAGVKVGPGAALNAHSALIAGSGGSAYSTVLLCKFGQLSRGAYLGLKFVINGQTHYGWAHVSKVQHNQATLTGYAYETVPNTPIATGKTSGPVGADLSMEPLSSGHPATLGLLAQGSRGLAVWRREEEDRARA
jgi:hypothetical protein